MSEPVLLREDDAGLCILTLNRPDKHNTLNQEIFKSLRREPGALETDQAIGCVVLRGAGRSFCAGHDLSDPPPKDPLGRVRAQSLVLERFAKLRQPVIASIQGYCFTGGLELALSADFIIAANSAQFADTHGKLGFVPGWGLSQRLPGRIGQAHALELMLTSLRYSGREAADHRSGQLMRAGCGAGCRDSYRGAEYSGQFLAQQRRQ